MFFWLHITFCLFSFTPNDSGFDVFQTWYVKHKQDLIKEKEHSKINYKVRVKPAELICWVDARKNKLSYKEYKKQVKSTEYFKVNLNISAKNSVVDLIKATSPNTTVYNQKLDYINNDLIQDLHIVTAENDTVTANDCIHIRTFGVNGQVNLSFLFEKTTTIKKIIFYDKLIIDQIIEFEFDDSIINKIPY